MNSILKKPYPLYLYSWKRASIIGVFIAVFLFAFQPFGLHTLDFKLKTWITLGYGLLTFITVCFNQFVLPKLVPTIFNEKKWTVFSQICWLLWNVLLIAIFNYYYSLTALNFPNDSTIFLRFVTYTILTSIIPLSIITVISHNRKLKNNLEKASILNIELHQQVIKPKPIDELVLVSSNQKESVKTTISDLLYIESIGNNARILWLENDQIQEKTIRNTLKDIESQVSHVINVFRSHKAFIVNLDQIKEVQGNAQGYKLTLKRGDFTIPVSRNYIKTFNATLENL